MISRIETLDFRSLRHVNRRLGSFHVLVGPNASGKTTFLDVITFLSDFARDGLERAVGDRTSDFRDLVWRRGPGSVELAIEATIPTSLRTLLPNESWDTIRYELEIGPVEASASGAFPIGIVSEKTVLLSASEQPEPLPELFPMVARVPETIVTPKGMKGTRTIVSKVPGGNDNFNSEVHLRSSGLWSPSFRLGPFKSALTNMPEDESLFPVSTWLKGVLQNGVQPFVLNSQKMRLSSPPGQPSGFKTDGSNLPWVVHDLKHSAPERYSEWVDHIKTALPDVTEVKTQENPDNKHRYLVLCYHGGVEIPSWMVSDGTLRLMALTLPAYIPEFKGVYLIEEPENGIHPKAMETVLQSLASAYSAQILLATHSPVVLSMIAAPQVLCFAKTDEGATDIVAGDEHPVLRKWQNEASLSDLFASGILG